MVEPDDAPAERDADRVASNVASGRSAAVHPGPAVGPGEPIALPTGERLLARRGGGTPLAPSLRASLEPLLRAPLSGVRVHADDRADQLAGELGAAAFTHGQDIFFARGRFASSDSAGLRLLSHELAHTVHARGLAAPPVMRQPSAPAQQKSGKLVRVVVYVDIGSVTLRLDDRTLVAASLLYNGHPNAGSYPATFEDGQYLIQGDQPVGGIPDATGQLLRWAPTRDIPSAPGERIMIDIVAGTGTVGGKTGAGSGVPATGNPMPSPPKPDQGSEVGHGKQVPTAPGTTGAGAAKQPGGDKSRQAAGAQPGGKGRIPARKPGGEGAQQEKTLSESEYVAKLRALPQAIKEIMGGETSFEPADYDKLLAVAEKLKKLSPVELEMYRTLASQTTHDLTLLEQSIDLFLATKDEIKRQLEQEAAKKGKESTAQQLQDTWKGFDPSKFASMSEDEKEALAREIATKQRDIQLKHVVSHPGEALVGAAEGIVRVDQLAKGIAEDAKEVADGSRNVFARTAAAMGITGKTSGWLAGVAGVVFVAALVIGAATGTLEVIAAVGLVAGAVSMLSAETEAELRIQSARVDKDPKQFQSDVEKSAAAEANAIVQAALLALHMAAKLVAKIPLGPKYQNVGGALRMARTSLLRVTGIGEAFESVRSGLLQRLRGSRGGLREALTAETKSLAATSTQITGMTGTQLLERIAAGDPALTEATGIQPEAAKNALAAAELAKSTAVADQVRRNVIRALDDAPKQAELKVQQFDDALDRKIAEVEKATTPGELQAAIDAAQGETSPETVAAQDRAVTQKYVSDRLSSDLAAAKTTAPSAPQPPKAPGQPGAGEPARPAPKTAPSEPAKAADQPAKPADQPAKAADQPAKAADQPAKAADQPAKPGTSGQTASGPDLGAEEQLLKQEEAAKATKPKRARAKKQSPQPDPKAEASRVEAARKRLEQAQQELKQMTAQRDALRAQQQGLKEQVEQALKEKRAALEQLGKSTVAAAKQKLMEQAKAAQTRMEKAAAAANDLGAEADGLGGDIADKQKAVRVADIEVDPKKSRAGLPCFSGDTAIWTADGAHRIDELSEGDLVLSYDFASGAVVPRRVRQVFRNRTVHFYELQVGAQTVRATGAHRFWVEDAGRWIAARDLRPGMLLRGPGGEDVVMKSSHVRDVEEQTSWNLAIEATPNYYVGPGVLVHNDGGFDTGLGGRITIYRATTKNPKFVGKVYVGQSVDIDIRTNGHRRFARSQLANRAALNADEIEFYEFMQEADLEPLVTGLNKDQADFLEQRNIELEREVRGANNVRNRREQIRSETHMKAVTERIENDPAVIKAGYCKR